MPENGSRVREEAPARGREENPNEVARARVFLGSETSLASGLVRVPSRFGVTVYKDSCCYAIFVKLVAFSCRLLGG